MAVNQKPESDEGKPPGRQSGKAERHGGLNSSKTRLRKSRRSWVPKM